MCWTFLIRYGTRLFMSESMEEQDVEILSQKFNIVAMVIGCISRFICTVILRYLNPGLLLRILAIAASVFTVGVISFQSIVGMYCSVGLSACMSLMFPTFYGIALRGLVDDAKVGAVGLLLALLGGSILLSFYASLIDFPSYCNLLAVNM